MIKRMITRHAAVLSTALVLLMVSPDSATACGISYEGGTPSPAEGCGETAVAVGAAAVMVAAGVAAVVVAIRSFLLGAMSAEDLRNCLNALQTQELWSALGRADATGEPLAPALLQSRRLEELAGRAAAHSQAGRATEAAEAAEEVAARLQEPISRTAQALSSAGQAVDNAKTALSEADPDIAAVRAAAMSPTGAEAAQAREQAEVAEALLKSARGALAEAGATLTEAERAQQQANAHHQEVARVAVMLRSAATAATGSAPAEAASLPPTVRAVTHQLSTAAQQSVEALTLASAVRDRLALADHLTAQARAATALEPMQQHAGATDAFSSAARDTILAEAADAAAKIHLPDRIPAFDAARNATARAHELAYTATQAAVQYRAVGSPSAELEAAAGSLAQGTRAMTEQSDVIRQGTGERVRKSAHDLQRTASDVVRTAAQVAHLIPPSAERQRMFGATSHDAVNSLARELGFELLNVAGQVPRIGSGSMEAARFLRAARGGRAGLEQARAMVAPGPPPRPEANPLRRVEEVSEVLAFGESFAPHGALDPDTDYQARHEHGDGQSYQAVYRTDMQGEIAEIWTPSGHQIHAGAAPGTRVVPNPELQAPRPNCVYHVDDRFTFVTDARGRTVLATGTVKHGGAARYDTQTAVGHQGNQEFPEVTFNGGHLFAAEFGGPGENINLVPEMQNLNQAVKTPERPVRNFLENWRRFEQEMGGRIRNGQEVHLTVELPRFGTSRTPSGFLATYVVNGVRQPPRPFVNFPHSSTTPGTATPHLPAPPH
ncbi:DNA/RNA non-specific endonuclease [Streptomyces bottropensis]|uniref:DNA/RNA non-specific endonuclease n=1 Tax=Streptomyces bottropensis TaxID=42235 RepID=UPI0036B270A4